MLPKVIKDAILSVEGIGYAGRVDSLDWPTLARKMEEYRAGGMHGPVEIDMGGEKLEMSFEMPEQDAALLSQFGVCSVNGMRFRINASAESDNPDCDSDGIEVIATGRMTELELGSYKGGDLQTTKYTIAVASFKYSRNGEPIIDIDYANNIFVVDKVDLLKKRRENLRM